MDLDRIETDARQLAEAKAKATPGPWWWQEGDDDSDTLANHEGLAQESEFGDGKGSTLNRAVAAALDRRAGEG